VQTTLAKLEADAQALEEEDMFWGLFNLVKKKQPEVQPPLEEGCHRVCLECIAIFVDKMEWEVRIIYDYPMELSDQSLDEAKKYQSASAESEYSTPKKIAANFKNCFQPSGYFLYNVKFEDLKVPVDCDEHCK
jgi:hypothetical protein